MRSLASFNGVTEDIRFTEAYYYAILSAALSATTLVCVIFHGLVLIQMYHSKPLRVESAGSNLYRQTIALIAYLLLGASFYAHIEDWSFLDAVFWADFTLLTIGLGGEFTPKTSLGRGLLLPYAIGGILFTALVVVSVRKLLLDGLSRQTDRLVDISRERLVQRLVTASENSASLDDQNTFDLVRRIPRDAQRRCSSMACAISIISAIVLFLGGASIFHLAEKDQAWTYGVSAYFAYISLLTIGYGDFIPNSDAGRPFFVVWSLLSVPVLTILINNSIDAIYGSFRGLWPSFVRLMQNYRCHWIGTPQPKQTAWASQSLHARHHEITGSEGVNSMGVNVDLRSRRQSDFLNSLFAEHNVSSWSHESAAVTLSEVDLCAYCCLLAREVGIITKDLVTEPGKKYSYQQWVYYINLMGRTSSYRRSKEEAQQVEGPGSAHTGGAGSSFTVRKPSSSIQWASRGTPILLPNEAEWLSLWLLDELTRSLHAMLAHDNKEHLSL
jgi:potassium channel subfamily K